jgi:hypothetical protein
MSTEIYLCHACSCQRNIEGENGRAGLVITKRQSGGRTRTVEFATEPGVAARIVGEMTDAAVMLAKQMRKTGAHKSKAVLSGTLLKRESSFKKETRKAATVKSMASDLAARAGKATKDVVQPPSHTYHDQKSGLTEISLYVWRCRC